MERKIFKKSNTSILGLIAFIATGGGLIISTIINEENFYKTEILIMVGCLFAISLVDHFRQITRKNDLFNINEKGIFVLICSFIGVVLTWYINHEMGYGPVIANGLVGVIAAICLPNKLAGIMYTSSFIGMSSLNVIPSVGAAAMASFIVTLILLTTTEVYAGIGGKGGTTAALSTIITKTIIRILS